MTRSAISSKVTSSSGICARVSCTIAIDPTRRTASSSAARPSGTRSRRDCSRSSAATVWRLFLTRWWISRIVASFVSSSRSPPPQLGHVTDQHQRADPPAGDDERDRPQLHDRAAALHLGLAGHLAAGDQHQVFVDRLVAVAEVGRGLAEFGADQVGVQPEAAVGAQRVRRGVGDPPGPVEPQQPVTHPRRPDQHRLGLGKGTAPRRPSGPGRRRSGDRSAPAARECGPRTGSSSAG